MPLVQTASKFLYVFLDESGDFNFSANGTPYFLLTSITKERPFDAFTDLHNLRYDLLEQGHEVMEFFHAAEDRQIVRNKVFEVIKDHLDGVKIDSIVIEKRKTGPALRALEKFYPQMLGYLLRYVLRQYQLSDYQEVLVFVASLHTGKQKNAVQKAVKQSLALMLPRHAKYRVIYHAAKANFDIQIANYCTWAIYKSLVGEHRPISYIQPAVRSTYDIFQRGTRHYY